jgi:hypothetical protein
VVRSVASTEEPKRSFPAVKQDAQPKEETAPAATTHDAAASTPAVAPVPAPAQNDAGAKAAAEGDQEDEADTTDEELILPRDTPGAEAERSAVEEEPSAVDPIKLPAGSPAGASRSAPAAALPSVKQARALLAQGKIDPAIKMLLAVRKRSPKSAEVALWLGHGYYRKHWRPDGMRWYSTAIDLRGGSKYDRTLQQNVIATLDDPSYRTARAFIKKKLGRAALGELRRVAKVSKSSEIRKRAARLVTQLGGKRRR